MFWSDRVAKEIIKSGKYQPYWVDDMKTPSGRIHVGSLRGVVMHDLIYKSLIKRGVKANFSYVFDDHDPMDALPVYLEEKKWAKYLGQPLFTIPSPDKNKESYASFFADEFISVFNKIGCFPKIIWASNLYKTGKMNTDIRLCLDKAKVIREIYQELYGKKMPDNWYPFQPVCPNCGKESTTTVTDWDGTKVTFSCQVNKVDWTKGCGFSGQISPFSEKGNFVGKLLWKVEWAVKWKVIGVTIEGAGKDHMSAGGSHDVAQLVCQRVINYPVPYPLMHEFFLIAGKKMSSSKGLGTSAYQVSQMIPPYLLRFLMVRTHIKKAIDFDPRGWTIPNLFDDYDLCYQAYTDGSDKDLARIFELSQVEKTPPKKAIFLPRFRLLAQLVQFPNVDPYEYFSQEKKDRLTSEERSILLERMKYAKLWLKQYAPDEAVFEAKKTLPYETSKLSDKQREFLKRLIPLIEKYHLPGELQIRTYQLAEELSLSSKDAFAAIYLSFFGKTHGPKAAWFLVGLDKNFVVKRLKESARKKNN